MEILIGGAAMTSWEDRAFSEHKRRLLLKLGTEISPLAVFSFKVDLSNGGNGESFASLYCRKSRCMPVTLPYFDTR